MKDPLGLAGKTRILDSSPVQDVPTTRKRKRRITDDHAHRLLEALFAPRYRDWTTSGYSE